ncbi:hypothetical protein BS47DRAFT_772646 [Hydnum rufescens UP504]|uniref:Uncharacterized protein n=1 Tax=Hydnum rufescens UP504 TaxID=1448309 RepID=A0A9P6B3H1_9AGAM|nr:hypothetical protein BS47DRAFT_772646 [Hydnum rufescens UP504]
MIPVQRMIPPSALKPVMFSLQKKEGRNVLLDDLDPAMNGISFRIDYGSGSQLDIEGFEVTSQGNFDGVEIILPETKPLGDKVPLRLFHSIDGLGKQSTVICSGTIAGYSARAYHP